MINKGDALDILLVVTIAATVISVLMAIEHAFYLYTIP
jgi:hypothetical protein